MVKPAIEKLAASHDAQDFDCGKPELNRFLVKHALQSQQSNSATTYVACKGKKIIGYYSLVAGAVEPEETPKRIKKGLSKHPVPLMILARLAVDRNEQGKGIGKGLLKDALLRTTQAAGIAGIRALVIHAKDDEAKSWYGQFDCEPSPTDPLHLYLLIKDIKKILREAGE